MTLADGWSGNGSHTVARIEVEAVGAPRGEADGGKLLFGKYGRGIGVKQGQKKIC